MPPTTLDTEERCRVAPQRLPRPGRVSRALGRHVEWSRRALLLVALGTAAVVARGGTPTGVLVLFFAVLAPLLAAVVELRRAVHEHDRADALFIAGRVHEAAALYEAVASRWWLVPAARAVAALSLARAATVAGHGERAFVLLRAIEASEALPIAHEEGLRTSIVLALLVMGRADEARAVLHSLRQAAPGVTLLVEALAGPLEDAMRAADEPASSLERGGNATYHAMRMQLGWLVRAWVAERVVRATADEAERASAAARRDAALREAGQVPPWMHHHLHAAWPDFGAFARDATAGVPVAQATTPT